MSGEKGGIPWPVWALVTIAVAVIPAYFAYKGSIEKNQPPKVEETTSAPEKKVDNNTESSTEAISANPDEEVTKKIIGTWYASYPLSGFNYDITITYTSDNRFSGKTDISNETGLLNTLHYRGNWNVSNNYHTLTITNTNSRQYLPIGTVLRNKIESINDNESVYIDNLGVRRTSQKLN